MTYLNRSLLRIGLLTTMLGSAWMGLMTVVRANPAVPRRDRAETTIHFGDSTVVKKDTIAALLTVPDSLLRDRLTKLQRDVPLNYHKSVQGYVDYFTFRKPGRTKLAMERIPLFFPLYERMLAEYGLPDELKFLSIVESDLTPRAISHAGAGGLWQIMPGTGRDLHLYQDEYVDERMDPVKATEAACKYLRDLYKIFGDWELALAGYNCGPGAVKRAMRRSGGDSFYTIYDALPKETRGYVPQFVAFTYLMHHGNDHGIFAENYQYPIPHDTIQVSGYFNLEAFAKHSTMPLADLQKMNPAITTTVLPEYTNRYPLRVPRQQYAYFASRRRAVMDSASQRPGIMAHTLLAHAEDVRYGDDSGEIWADLGSNPLARLSLDETPTDEGETAPANAGSTPAKRTAQVAAAEPSDEPEDETVVAPKKVKVIAQTKRFKPRYHRVQDGDTLWNIARRYDGLTIDRLKKMNHIHGNALRPGQKLIVG